MWNMAHVAVLSEWEVVVVASLANPITRSFVSSLGLLEGCLDSLLIKFERWFAKSFCWCLISRFRLLGVNLKTLDLHCFPLLLKFEWWLFLISLHMNWLSSRVLDCLRLLASIALFSALKVIILTFRALPTALWELELSLTRFLSFLKMTLFTRFIWSITWSTLSFWRSIGRIRLFITAALDLITIIFLDWSSLIDLKIDPGHIFL